MIYLVTKLQIHQSAMRIHGALMSPYYKPPSDIFSYKITNTSMYYGNSWSGSLGEATQINSLLSDCKPT
jgi:hypothetical protein